MIRVKRQQLRKFAKFAGSSETYIKSHTEIDGRVTFNYVIPIIIDQSLIGQLDGDLQIRIFRSKRKNPAISVKRSDIAGSNIMKKIDQQRSEQIASRLYNKTYFFKKFIDRPDLSRGRIEFEADILERFINDNVFTVEIAAVRIDGSSTTVDTIDINHTNILRAYDTPTDNFRITADRNEKGEISIAGVSEDPTIKGFNFYYRKDSSTSFVPIEFLNLNSSFLDSGKVATTRFNSRDGESSYTIRAIPVSRFFAQKVGNFYEQKIESTESAKRIPMYVSGLYDDRVDFSIFKIDDKIKKIFLYRELLITGEKFFVGVANVTNGSSSVISDISRIPQYDFKYTIEYIDGQGQKQISSTEIIVPGLKLDKIAKISATRVKDGSLDFDVVVKYQTSTIYDEIIKDLDSMGLRDLYSTDLEKMTNNLKPITRVLVSRISQETGAEEDIGVYQPGRISLSRTTGNSSSSGYIYRFEVAIRSVPESLEMLASGKNILSNNAFNIGSTSDLASKKIGNKYDTSTSFSSKFFTKSAIKKSTILAGDSLSLSDLNYYSGRTGVFSDVKINKVMKNAGSVSSISIVSTKKGRYISWNYSGNIKFVDFFRVVIGNQEFKSFPTSDPSQVFFIGNRNLSLSSILINAIMIGENKSPSANNSRKM